MELEGKRLGFALTGSHCNLEPALGALEDLLELGAEVTPILSESVSRLDTRFGRAEDWLARVRALTGHEPLTTVVGAEPIGPQGSFDLLAVCPCTGNTLAKIAQAVTDGVVPMAVKAQLRNRRPVVIAVSTNDGLGLNAKNLGLLLASRHIYFVPFRQDDPMAKPTSIIADFSLLSLTIKSALGGQQIQPVLLGPAR